MARENQHMNIKNLFHSNVLIPVVIIILTVLSVALHIKPVKTAALNLIDPPSVNTVDDLRVCCTKCKAVHPCNCKCECDDTDESDAPSVDASEPVAHIPDIGTIEAEPGELIEIDLSEAVGTTFKWLVQPPTDNVRIIEGGRRLLFSHGKRAKFEIVVATALGGTVDVKRIVIKIGRGTPDPRPDPGPDPIPDDGDNLSGLARSASAWIDLVDSDSKREETLALAQSFGSIAAMISAGVESDPQSIIKMTATSNKQALGDSSEAWKPFMSELRRSLNSLSKQGKLKSASDHAKVWRNISKALREVAEIL